jgi:hypothetical protein
MIRRLLRRNPLAVFYGVLLCCMVTVVVIPSLPVRLGVAIIIWCPLLYWSLNQIGTPPADPSTTQSGVKD